LEASESSTRDVVKGFLGIVSSFLSTCGTGFGRTKLSLFLRRVG
jgi:hypothetical protein